ncbi:DUF4381 domain-containing protein [Microbulbifer sp.]|uniref:DUF4381 domain-containing protein n=1 Tax=Microbulbifer sp. TaxID=1908541 RepID=UPI0025851384|nr:DUF4381 domain-containing protein [Microbulbifer sp.]
MRQLATQATPQQNPPSPPLTPEMEELLTQLKDIQEPAAVGWWPPAPGWWLAAVIVFSLLIIAGLALLHLRRKRQQRRYRTEGIHLLRAVDVKDPRAVEEINILLKRVAVVSFGRRRCAALTGQQWIDFLQRTSGEDLPAPARTALLEGLYLSNATGEGVPTLRDYAIRWVNRHDTDAFSAIETVLSTSPAAPSKSPEATDV